MFSTHPSTPGRTAIRARSRVVTVGVLLLVALIVGPVSQQLPRSTTSTITTPFDAFLGKERRALGEDGGELPGGVTAFDDDYAGVANLDRDLLRALRAATDDARRAGVRLQVNSGWRSADYQEQLLDAAVEEHGSREEAARWVATPTTSAHVSGDAVDIGQADAASWLADHGATYGLCRTYRNEPWHFELRPEASVIGCPQPYADPTQDPRLQQ